MLCWFIPVNEPNPGGGKTPSACVLPLALHTTTSGPRAGFGGESPEVLVAADTQENDQIFGLLLFYWKAASALRAASLPFIL